jgi:hypothetical protein
MAKRSTLLASALAAAISCSLLGGCIVAAAAAGAAVYGAISYDENEAWMDFHADLPKVWTAMQDSLQENGYAPDRTRKPAVNEGALQAGEATVKMERNPGGFTRVRVRVGTFDSEENRRHAGLILEGMKKRLAP